MPDLDPLSFAVGLLERGIEFVLRKNGRLHVWPGPAHKYLTDAERAFIHEHRDELKALAASRALPEATVKWNPPHEGGPEPAPTPAPRVPSALCAYCGDRLCVGPDHRWFRVLHWHDPAEVARRSAEATQIMMRQVGRDCAY